MTHARKFHCTLTSSLWLSPKVLQITFRPDRLFDYVPGQFFAMITPNGEKRAFSFLDTAQTSQRNGYRALIKILEGGVASGALKALKTGDSFDIMAPYGDFRAPPTTELNDNTSICLISTGTGIAPLHSIAQGLREQGFEGKIFNLFGCKSEEDILCLDSFLKMNIPTMIALGRGNTVGRILGPLSRTFSGRVTDYLQSVNFGKHATEFYLCGNPDMVIDTGRVLRDIVGIAPQKIHQELFLSKTAVSTLNNQRAERGSLEKKAA